MKLIIKEIETTPAVGTELSSTRIPSLSDVQGEVIKFQNKAKPYSANEISSGYQHALTLLQQYPRSFGSNMAFGAYLSGFIDGLRMSAPKK